MPTRKQKLSAWSERLRRDEAARRRRASENRLQAYALYDLQRKLQRSKVAPAASRPCAAIFRGYYADLLRASLVESLNMVIWEPSPVDQPAFEGRPPIVKKKNGLNS